MQRAAFRCRPATSFRYSERWKNHTHRHEIVLELCVRFDSAVDSLLTDTSIRRTVRVGPCLSLLPLFDSL